jgi:hypothetical protein
VEAGREVVVAAPQGEGGVELLNYDRGEWGSKPIWREGYEN